jgi:HAD superfamily hydrolase (TIGR01549 family)
VNSGTNNRQGVIFDLDGTLAQTRLDFDGIRAELELTDGTPILEAIEQMAPDAAARAWDVLDRHETIAAESAEAMPGAVELLATLATRGWPVAILTRNSRRAAEATLLRLGIKLGDSITELIAREDGPIKPDPTAVWRICEAWELPRRRVVLIGDHWFDIETARRAGVRSVLYTGSHDGKTPKKTAAADFMLASFAPPDALLAWLDEHNGEPG